ncbi:MAG TPA: 2-phospho-L-lactate guanylyltransferase [Solirubrobacteraceae bacterium]
MLTAAILPVKSFGRAKQRLGASLLDAQRLALAQAMVGDVLQALAASRAIARTIVVTAEPQAREAALHSGGDAIVIADEHERGQSAAALIGIERAIGEGFQRVLCVPGDCPAIDARELDTLLAEHDADPAAVVVFPDRHGSGTNGLMLCPPDAIEPSFGPDSRQRHVELARTANQEVRVREVASLLLDVDTGADLAVLRARLGQLGDRAERTRAVLVGAAFSDTRASSTASSSQPPSQAAAPAARA